MQSLFYCDIKLTTLKKQDAEGVKYVVQSSYATLAWSQPRNGTKSYVRSFGLIVKKHNTIN